MAENKEIFFGVSIDSRPALKSTQQLTKAINRGADAQKNYKKRLRELNKAYKDGDISSKRFAKREEFLTKKLDKTAISLRKLKSEYREASNAAAGLTQQGLRFRDKIADGLTSKFNAVGAAIGAAFAVGVLKNFFGGMLDIIKEFEKFEAVLTNTLGSESEAQQALKEIQSFAAETPFQVSELTESFVKLVNQGFKPTSEEMRKLGDLASSQGKSFDQLTEGIIDAQTGEFERLKEFGVRASKEGDKVTFTFKGVETQVDFTSDSIRQYVLSLGDAEGVSGSMAAISETLTGKISNSQDAWDQFVLSLDDGDGVISRVVKGATELWTDLLTSITNANEATSKGGIFGYLMLQGKTEKGAKAAKERQEKEAKRLKEIGEEISNITDEELERARIEELSSLNRLDYFGREIEGRKNWTSVRLRAIEQEVEARKKLAKVSPEDAAAEGSKGGGKTEKSDVQKELEKRAEVSRKEALEKEVQALLDEGKIKTDTKLELLRTEGEVLGTEEDFLNQQIQERNKQHNEEMVRQDWEAAQTRRAIQQEVVNSAGDIFSQIESLAKEGSKLQEASLKAQKAAALAEIAINLQRELSHIGFFSSANPANLLSAGTVGVAQAAALSGIAIARAGVSAATVLAAAGGADFVTSGPQLMMVGDNPGGKERVTVEPLSGKGQTKMIPAFGGGGSLIAGSGSQLMRKDSGAQISALGDKIQKMRIGIDLLELREKQSNLDTSEDRATVV